jgi:hypothetical protein
VQFAQIYIDLDPADPAGHTAGLAGVNVNFEPGWNKVVLISPQPTSRVAAEVAEKATDVADDVLIPDRTWARGRRLYARVPRAAFGDSDPTTWGVQILMQSNEGYPTATDLLTRRVNEFEGPHRFGGGNDFDCDPHVMDILTGEAVGAAGEVELQHTMLGNFTCEADGTGTQATVTFIVR